MSRAVHALLIALLICSAQPGAAADGYTLVVQPLIPPAAQRQAYGPLVRYLSERSGYPIRLVTARNFVTYWERMRRPGAYDLILDAAHFTAFRIARMGYRPLAKLPDVVSFSLITDEDTLIFSPDELVGKRVATLASPSLGALRLTTLFPNPVKQPLIVATDDSRAAVDSLLAGEVVAAVIPTPIARDYDTINTVLTTEQVPHMALSASPEVPAEVQSALREALLDADRQPTGRRALARARLAGFEPASTSIYRGYDRLLSGVWGY
jgi:phosphonate transport system substrate-binding protein